MTCIEKCEHEWKEKKVQCCRCDLIMNLSDAMFENAGIYMEEGRKQTLADVGKIIPKLGMGSCHADGCDCDYIFENELMNLRGAKGS